MSLVKLCLRAGNYDEYFGMATDVEAVVYLMLQNQLLHDLFPTVVTIGEDVSGMPTFCRSASITVLPSLLLYAVLPLLWGLPLTHQLLRKR